VIGRLLAVAWARFQPRTRALARDFGGRHVFVSPGGPTPLRYVRAAIATWRRLGRDRPHTALVITPPVFAPLVAWAWCACHRRQLIVDCHTGSFDSRKWGWARPIHRFLLRRAAVVMLHTDRDLDLVTGWVGDRAMLFPDDVPDHGEASRGGGTGAQVMVAGSLDENEPVVEMLETARLLPEVTFAFTGDPGRLSREQLAALPGNVRLTGLLTYPDFLAELNAAAVVAVLSSDSRIMNRAAFEAVGLGRPLVLTDFPGLRSRFGSAAVFTANEPPAIARVLSEALAGRDQLAARSHDLARRLRDQRARAMGRLRDLLERRRRERPMRALMVTQHPYPQAPFVRRNVDQLLDAGVEVDLVCSASPPDAGPVESTVPSGLRVYRAPVRHRRQGWRYLLEYGLFFGASFVLAAWLSVRRRPEVMQVDNPPDALILTAAIPRLRGAWVVFNMVELFPELLSSRMGIGQRHPLLRLARWSERFAAGWADQVLTVSETCRRIVVSRGVDRDRIEIVPNSLEIEPGETFPVQAREAVIVTHASLIERYGIQVAIRALGLLATRWPQIRLEVLGHGEYRPVLERLADRLGLRDRVVFTGFLPWPEAMARISRAAVGVVPVIEDGYGHLLLPTKLMEYAELRVPAAVSRLPAIQEYFPEDSLAYFRAGDAEGLAAQIDRLLRDPQAARAQAERAFAAMERLRWSAVSGRYLAALGVV
jgi:glycosyltransferase involved in cell wall biosynthesis